MSARWFKVIQGIMDDNFIYESSDLKKQNDWQNAEMHYRNGTRPAQVLTCIFKAWSEREYHKYYGGNPQTAL